MTHLAEDGNIRAAAIMYEPLPLRVVDAVMYRLHNHKPVYKDMLPAPSSVDYGSVIAFEQKSRNAYVRFRSYGDHWIELL